MIQTFFNDQIVASNLEYNLLFVRWYKKKCMECRWGL